MNECQKRDELQKHQIRRTRGIQGKEYGHGKKNGDQKKELKLEENCFLLVEFPIVDFSRMT